MRHAFFLAFLAVLPRAGRAQPAAQTETNPLKPGYRAISLSFDGDRVFYLSPDDRVDVIVVYDRKAASEPKSQPAAGTLLKKVRVMAVKPSSEPGRSVVRFEVNPTEGQYLESSARAGNIWLALRTKGDVEDAPMEFVSWSKLFGPDFKISRRARAPMSAAPSKDASADPKTMSAVRTRMQQAYTALSVPIASDKVSFIRPGDRIDLLATVNDERTKDPANHGVTMTLLQNIRVLDNRRSASRPGESFLLLALNYNEAQYAALAADTAELQVLSRGTSDEEMYTLEAATLDKW